MRKESVKVIVMNDFTIFLSGKITGLNELDANGWREEFMKAIDADWFGYGFSRIPHVINPCDVFGGSSGMPTWKLDKEYVRFELRNAANCDLLVVAVSRNQDSIGTACELATAYSSGVPILLYNPYEIPHEKIHPFVWEMSDGCFEDMDELVNYIKEVYLV